MLILLGKQFRQFISVSRKRRIIQILFSLVPVFSHLENTTTKSMKTELQVAINGINQINYK